MTVCAPAFLQVPFGYQTVRHWFDDEAVERGEDWTGWFIVYVDGDGEAYDAIGPFDSEGEARCLIGDAEYRP